MIMAAAGTGCTSVSVKEYEALREANRLTEQEKSEAKFTPEVMWKMGRVGAPVISPDGTKVLYTVTYYDMNANSGHTALFMVPSEGGEEKMVAVNADSPQWSGNGEKVYFLAPDRNEEMQVWYIDAAKPAKNKLVEKIDNISGNIEARMRGVDAVMGCTPVKVTDIEGGVEGFGISPNDCKLFYVKAVAVADRKSSDIYPDMAKSGARIYDDIMARHWNYWDEGSYRHIFVADLAAVGEDAVKEGTDIMEGEAWDSPMAPYFDMSEIAWNADGSLLAYTCKKMTGKEYAVSTDSDIYVYDVASGQTSNICKFGTFIGQEEVYPGYDRYPVFSPDGRKMAFRSMRRAGNESDIEHLVVWNAADNSLSDITPTFDYSVENVVWNGNDSVRFVAAMQGTYQICSVSLAAPDSVQVLTAGDHDITAFAAAGDKVVFSMSSISQAPELYLLAGDNEYRQLTFVNKEIYDNIKLAEVQKRWVETSDGKQMLTWVILPSDFNAENAYPALLYCQGGPQSVVSQFWSYRWNFQLMAAQGYVVVAPNRRGVPSFGSEWLDQISGDYSGQNIRDYLSAIDDVAKEEWVDSNRLGAVGASYGGYSIFYLAGVHQNRFKALIAHCGIFDFESMYGETEELWFVNRDYGGSYWDDNETARRSYANSPHKLVDKWTAPILIFTGEKDFRIPYTQSLEAFTAARMHNVPARLVEFQDEAHQVFKPQNSMVWNREFFGWLDKYLK